MEQIVLMLVGLIATTGLTQWIKAQTGVAGVGAMAVALAISFVIALAAWTVSQVLAGGFSLDEIPGAALKIFALATIAYKALLADGSSDDKSGAS